MMWSVIVFNLCIERAVASLATEAHLSLVDFVLSYMVVLRKINGL